MHRASEKLTAVFFIVSGRLQATAFDMFGTAVLERYLVRGSAYGLFSVANPEQATANVAAVEPSNLIRLNIERLLELVARHADLQMNLYRLAGTLVRQFVMLDRKACQPSSVGVVHQSEASRSLTPRLVQRLMEIESNPCVTSDDSNWQSIEGVPFQLLLEDARLIPEQQRRAKLKDWADRCSILSIAA